MHEFVWGDVGRQCGCREAIAKVLDGQSSVAPERGRQFCICEKCLDVVDGAYIALCFPGLCMCIGGSNLHRYTTAEEVFGEGTLGELLSSIEANSFYKVPGSKFPGSFDLFPCLERVVFISEECLNSIVRCIVKENGEECFLLGVRVGKGPHVSMCTRSPTAAACLALFE